MDSGVKLQVVWCRSEEDARAALQHLKFEARLVIQSPLRINALPPTSSKCTYCVVHENIFWYVYLSLYLNIFSCMIESARHCSVLKRNYHRYPSRGEGRASQKYRYSSKALQEARYGSRSKKLDLITRNRKATNNRSDSDCSNSEDARSTELGHRMGRGTGWATPTTSDHHKDEAAQPHTIVIITRKVVDLVSRCLRTFCTI
jgi:hypothetical protein